MEKRNVILGFITLGIIAGAVYVLFRNTRSQAPQITTLPSPTASSEKNLENKFNLVIPDNLEKAELKSNSSTSGIATKKYEAGLFSIDILADLSESGGVYKAWLAKDGDLNPIFMGDLFPAKGGYILNYDVSSDLNDYKRVIITSGNSQVIKSEEILLQGNFK